MKTLFVVATLVTCLMLRGSRQGPSPTQLKPGSKVVSTDPKQADSGRGGHGVASPGQPAADATDKNAVAVTVPRQSDKIEVTALPPEIAIKQIRDSIDCTILYCTIILTIVGLVGTGVAVWTLFAIKDQAKTLHEHSEELRKLAEAARENAAAANKNAEATGAAVKIAQATLVSTFRPKLIVRGLSMYRDTATVDDVKPCRVGYDLVNIGGTAAHIVQREVCVHYNKGWDVGDVSSTEKSKEEFTLRPGEFREEFVELGTEVTQRLGHLETRLAQGVNNPVMVGEMFLTGRVEYRDDTGATRRTAFHRSYNQETKRFSVVTDPDYEYSD